MQQTSVWNRWAPPATRNLIVINILLWLASLALLRHGIDLDSLFGLHYFAASDFRLHQLLGASASSSTTSSAGSRRD